MARAAQMVLTCNPVLRRDAGRQRELELLGRDGCVGRQQVCLRGTGGGRCGCRGTGTCAGWAKVPPASQPRRGCSVLWASSIPPETTTDAASANQRPPPTANSFLPTNSSLIPRSAVSTIFLSLVRVIGLKSTADRSWRDRPSLCPTVSRAVRSNPPTAPANKDLP